MRVVVLEAGGDPRDAPGLPEDYDVPAFHTLASENPAMRWDFFVRHYADEERQHQDCKLQPEGIYYPRAGTLGGCTAHNALILMPPHDADWDAIAAMTGDPSWSASDMRRYFQLLEACRYRPVWRTLSHLGMDMTGHGWDGWLPSERVQAVAGGRGPAAAGDAHRVRIRRLARVIATDANPPAAAPVAAGPQRHAPVATRCRWALLHAARHRSAQEGWNARAPARCRGTPS